MKLSTSHKRTDFEFVINIPNFVGCLIFLYFNTLSNSITHRMKIWSYVVNLRDKFSLVSEFEPGPPAIGGDLLSTAPPNWAKPEILS